MTAIPQFHDLQKAITKSALKLHASEIHGLMCGILSGNIREEIPNWEQLINQSETKTPVILKKLFKSSTEQLKQFLFEFEIVLPDDDQHLCMRAEGLTVWCQGFLTGLKLSNVSFESEDEDFSEAISDLIEIAKMNYEKVVESEEDENAYMELVEYVRMAVILIYQTLHKQVKVLPSEENSLNCLH
jgi:uncharacterized protein YgfB (UPF0149 family)